eukprot:4278392-Amphidinium_carterae.1
MEPGGDPDSIGATIAGTPPSVLGRDGELSQCSAAEGRNSRGDETEIKQGLITTPLAELEQ